MSGNEIAGRVTITWPAPENGELPGHMLEVRNADTGEQHVDVCGLAIQVNAAGPITVDLRHLADRFGDPLGPGRAPIFTAEYIAWLDTHPDETAEYSGTNIVTVIRRYLVAEMHVAGTPLPLATGGVIPPGAVVIVGENGPEFTFPDDATGH